MSALGPADASGPTRDRSRSANPNRLERQGNDEKGDDQSRGRARARRLGLFNITVE